MIDFSLVAWITCRMRTLASIYPLINVITSSSLLAPLFRTLDAYGWYPVNFTHSVLKALSNSKTKEAYSKPAYLHVVLHVADLLPMLAEPEEASDMQMEGREAMMEMAMEVGMVEQAITPQLLVIVSNVLAVSD